MTIPTVSTGDDILASWANQVASDVNLLLGKYFVLQGMILMWHGLLSTIPSGWVLCDGNNGTPNLLDRFIQQVPNASTDPTQMGGATSKTTLGHTHSVPNTSSAIDPYTRRSGDGVQNLKDEDHYHTVPDVDSNTDSITDIRPKYMTLAFIMKS